MQLGRGRVLCELCQQHQVATHEDKTQYENMLEKSNRDLVRHVATSLSHQKLNRMSALNSLSLVFTANTGSRPDVSLYEARTITLPEGVRVLLMPAVQS